MSLGVRQYAMDTKEGADLDCELCSHQGRQERTFGKGQLLFELSRAFSTYLIIKVMYALSLHHVHCSANNFYNVGDKLTILYSPLIRPSNGISYYGKMSTYYHGQPYTSKTTSS